MDMIVSASERPDPTPLSFPLTHRSIARSECHANTEVRTKTLLLRPSSVLLHVRAAAAELVRQQATADSPWVSSPIHVSQSEYDPPPPPHTIKFVSIMPILLALGEDGRGPRSEKFLCSLDGVDGPRWTLLLSPFSNTSKTPMKLSA